MNSLLKYNFKLFVKMIIFMSLFLVTKTLALETPTHRAINEHIAEKNLTFSNFSLHQYLIKQLGLQNGVETPINNKWIIKWLGDGGEKEDSYLGLRFLNHFLDPISNTGLAGQYSALQWALMDAGTQSFLVWENNSWNDARSYYYTALTALDKLTRETNYAETFRALGQVMHLVQDMSVPEHTRNNGHYFGYDYESWRI